MCGYVTVKWGVEPGNVTFPGTCRAGSRCGRNVVYFFFKSASGKCIIISGCKVKKDSFVGRKCGDSNGYVLDQVFNYYFGMVRKCVDVIEGLIWFVVGVI